MEIIGKWTSRNLLLDSQSTCRGASGPVPGGDTGIRIRSRPGQDGFALGYVGRALVLTRLSVRAVLSHGQRYWNSLDKNIQGSNIPSVRYHTKRLGARAEGGVTCLTYRKPTSGVSGQKGRALGEVFVAPTLSDAALPHLTFARGVPFRSRGDRPCVAMTRNLPGDLAARNTESGRCALRGHHRLGPYVCHRTDCAWLYD